eukprot:TRINITY_DN4130_c0_g1_i1.p1 TRINITY_DN4130_c0_g1~~TRINITY_DN4130_c0_g1_i1.p1  ORF type:complete len:240 (+),score=39.02 TRINITY_DN4130_c0_g1_i1:26-745(+)
MAKPEPSSHALEKRFFGFHPVHFVDNIINHVNDYLGDCVDAFEEAVTKYSSVSAAQAATKLYDLYQKSLDRNFDKYEVFLFQYIFSVSPEVLQRQSDNQRAVSSQPTVMSEADEFRLDQELESLRVKLRYNELANVRLQETVNAMTADLCAFDSVSSHLEGMDVSGVPQMLSSIAQNITSTSTLCAQSTAVLRDFGQSESQSLPCSTLSYRARADYISIRAGVQTGSRGDLAMLRTAIA